jgi:hypothetical protein|tara:strand:- start:86 stop:799 length:714 start_codon:yes stop_codon:yes gene_type:complete
MTKDLNPKEYKQMMEYLTRKKPETIRTPVEVPKTRLKPLIDLEKELEKYEDDFVANRGKQTEALINTTNKHINKQIKNGNIKREDMLLREDGNGLMVNKNRTIAVRDSFVAKQFNKALGVNNEPEASPEQFGKLAERLERNRQMQGKGTNVRNFKNQFGSSPYVKNLQKKKAAAIPTTPIKLDTTLPPSFFRSPPRDPQMEALGKKVMEDARRDREEKERMANSGLAGLIGGALKNE